MNIHRSLLASVSILVLSASASFAEGTPPAAETPKAETMTVSVAAAPAEVKTTVVDAQTGKKIDPATTGSTVPAATPVAAKPDKAAQCAVLIKQRDTATNAVDGVQAINAMAKLGGCPSSTADKGKASAKPRTAATGKPAAAVASVKKPAKVNADQMKAEYTSQNSRKPPLDPLTAGIPAMHVSPLRFDIFTGFGLASGGVKKVEDKTGPQFEVGGNIRYELMNGFGVLGGIAVGSGSPKAEKREVYSYTVPQKILAPLTFTGAETTTVSFDARFTGKVGLTYAYDRWLFGANALLVRDSVNYSYLDRVNALGPIPPFTVANVTGSKDIYRLGGELTARYNMDGGWYFEGAVSYIASSKLSIVGTKLDVNDELNGKFRLGYSF